MTTFEHAMLGINGVLACGLHKRFGWSIVALGGLAAVLPDWDGLPMLVDMARFEGGHRVWGHNVLACVMLGTVLGCIDYRFDVLSRIAKRFVRFGPFQDAAEHVHVRRQFDQSGLVAWVAVSIIAALSQIPADAVVSGAKGISDWAVQPLWPFSEAGFVHPMVPWGNVGITIVFVLGMLLQAKFPRKLQTLGIATLTLATVYIVVWGAIFYDVSS